MQPFKFVQLADIQFGLFEYSSGMADEEIARLARMGVLLRPAPPMKGLGPERELLSGAIAAINGLDPAFAIMCGDIANEPLVQEQFDAATEILSGLKSGTPFYWVPGNHDVASDFTVPEPELLERYRAQFGDDYYSFRVDEAAFFVINSTVLAAPDAVPGEAEAQMEFLERELAATSRDGLPLRALFTHHPPFLDDPDEPNSMWNIHEPYRRRLLELLQAYEVTTVFAGHLHRNHEFSSDDIQIITTGSVGYPLGDDPSGYRVVDVDEDGFNHQFVPLSAPPDNSVAKSLMEQQDEGTGERVPEAMTSSTLYEFLRGVPMFSGLTDADLSELAEQCEVVELEPEAMLFEEGAKGDAAYVVRAGRIDILKRSGSRSVLLSELNPGSLFGEMALLDDSPRMAGAKAGETTTVVRIGKDVVQTLLKKSVAVQEAMFDLVLGRLKSTEAQLRQSERMVQLGTLSAGIAHELNNPAAAAKRASGQLAEAIEMFGAAYRDFAATGPDPATIARADELILQARERAADPVDIDPFDRSDAEAEIGDWLDDNGVEDAWNVSCDLVTAGYSRPDLEEWAVSYEASTSAQMARLVACVVSVSTLLETVSHATGRVSDIVDGLKAYSFLDQAPIQAVNVPAGIDQTLTLLRSRLEPGIKVTTEYEAGIPDIDAHGSDLNQVWTNLINNAIDAIGDEGHIEISVKQSERGGVTVTFTDSGHGVPEEIQDRIFDAFFTTREPGKGTGLGLHATYDIVVNKHHGNISVESQPGHTVFTVELPARQQDE